MGLLRSEHTGRSVSLGSRVLVGRGGVCALRIESRVVSQEHAAIWWEHGGWWVRDQGSRNGTFLGGRRLDGAERARVEVGARVIFGHDEHTWTLVDGGPPVALARSAAGRVVVARGGMLSVPSEEAPEVMVFQEADGGWRLEGADHSGIVRDGTPFVAAGEAWILHLPLVDSSTLNLSSGGVGRISWSLAFRVSRDEEFIEVEFDGGGGRVLLAARAHHELLLLLARARIDDADHPGAERGWRYVDELQRALGIDAQRLNMHVFRARQQLAEHDPAAAGLLLERRPTTGQVRLGIGLVSVEPLGE